jgi:aryl-alcohol dehydrogenase-like predicted oxidoreductase
MLPLCADEGVGTIVWSPLTRGCLAREHDVSTYASMLRIASASSAGRWSGTSWIVSRSQ